MDADVTADIGVLTEIENSEKGRRFHLTGICTGDPYTLTLAVGEKTVVFTDIYVGDDWILGGQSNMYHLCFDPHGMTSTLAPQVDSISVRPLAVRYKNLNGRLTSEGRPTGYALSMSQDKVDRHHIVKVTLHGDTSYIGHELPREEFENAYLFYLFGNDSYANITDEDGRPIPAMGPISLREYLK